jgi:hypothetical protein
LQLLCNFYWNTISLSCDSPHSVTPRLRMLCRIIFRSKISRKSGKLFAQIILRLSNSSPKSSSPYEFFIRKILRRKDIIQLEISVTIFGTIFPFLFINIINFSGKFFHLIYFIHTIELLLDRGLFKFVKQQIFFVILDLIHVITLHFRFYSQSKCPRWKVWSTLVHGQT